MSDSKIKSLNKLAKIIARLKRQGKRIAFTNGCFDILHLGHIRYLEKAKRSADVLVVAVNSDKSVKVIKGPNRPITNQNDRTRVLAALESVDYVTIFNESNPCRVIKLLRPDVLIKGADWKKEEIIGAKFVESYGGKIKRVPFIKGRSTSAIISAIKGH